MRVLFAEYLTWNTPYRVGSHYYARHFLDLGWEVGWLGGEFHALNLLQNRAELARKRRCGQPAAYSTSMARGSTCRSSCFPTATGAPCAAPAWRGRATG
jgi:hypothetical protein